MALLKFISLSVGSLMLLQGAYVSVKAAPVLKDCSSDMNKARSAVGLPDITHKQKNLLESGGEAQLAEVCKLLQQENEESLSPDVTNQGTVAFAKDSADCAAAVEEYKKGFEKFKSNTTSAPPKFALKTETAFLSQLGAAPYDSQSAVNFATLYTTQTSEVECAVVTCQQKEVELPSSGTNLPEVKGMVCIAYPPALKNETAPWTDDQWKGILNVHAAGTSQPSSATAAVPTLLALATAAVGVALI